MMKAMGALLAALAATLAVAADDAMSIESFFKLPQYGAMVLSPDGENIAALSGVAGHQNIVVINLAKHAATPVTAMTSRDVVTVRWLNNKRLLFTTGSLGTRADDARGGGLFAVDMDGNALRILGEGSDEQRSAGLRAVFRFLGVVRTLPGDGDEFIAQEVAFEDRELKPGGLYRVDSRSGRRTNIGSGKPEAVPNEAWVVDAKGVARAFVAVAENRARIYYRKDEDSPWQKLDDFSTLEGNGWIPVAIADDGTLIVSSHRGHDKAALVRYDPRSKSFGEVIAAHPQVNLEDLAYDRDGRVIGVRYSADKEGVAWFDDDMARVQSAIDRSFPGSVNTLSASRDHQRFLITSRSDVAPGSYYLFDRKTGKVEWLADRRPWIDPKKMSPMTAVRYTARDGLEIPAYLTVPKGSSGRNLPLVVMVHGGPWVSGDDWRWNPEVQFLASRGYAVLQPNFRGTTRYGWKHFSSSFRQWGLTMQDDVADGTLWAIKEGIADPARVCIYGASYGGYATMMGLAKTPDLYKCGVNYVGVTDLELFQTATWSDFAYSDFLKFAMKEMFGDVTRDSAQIKATSPVLLASRIKSPVMMAYGAADVRVVPEHGTRMKAALENSGRTVEWMMVEGEGHGYRDLNNQMMFYGKMEKFLARHIGSARN